MQSPKIGATLRAVLASGLLVLLLAGCAAPVLEPDPLPQTSSEEPTPSQEPEPSEATKAPRGDPISEPKDIPNGTPFPCACWIYSADTDTDQSGKRTWTLTYDQVTRERVAGFIPSVAEMGFMLVDSSEVGNVARWTFEGRGLRLDLTLTSEGEQIHTVYVIAEL